MKFTSTTLPGVIIIEPRCFRDERGFFMETFQAQDLLKPVSRRLSSRIITPPPIRALCVGCTIRWTMFRASWCAPWPAKCTMSPSIYAAVLPPLVNGYRLYCRPRTTCRCGSQPVSPTAFIPSAIGVSCSTRPPIITIRKPSALCCGTILALAIPWPLIDGEPPLLSSKDERGIPFKDAEMFA